MRRENIVLLLIPVYMQFSCVQVEGATIAPTVDEPQLEIEELHSPRVTDWGDWGEMESCPDKTFVRGMRLKTEPAQGPGDDTALNGISFMCGVIGEPQKVLHSPSRQIQSLVGKWGTYGGSFECPDSYAIGFQLRSEPNQGSHDDTAANSLRLFCSSTEINTVSYLEGSGLSWGEWTEPQLCSPGKAICGIKTQVENAKGHSGDDSSLNNVDVQCCSLPTHDNQEEKKLPG